MKVLSIGIDPTTLMFLRGQGVATEAHNEIADIDELIDWLKDGNFHAALINIDEKFGTLVCREIRRQQIVIPVLGTSSGSPEMRWSEHRTQFLENGGDDLLRAPVNPGELHASLRAATRRFVSFVKGLTDVFELTHKGAHLAINLGIGKVAINGTRLELTGREFSAVILLAEAAGRVLSKEQILEGMYTSGVDDEPEAKIVDVFICKVRAKMKSLHEGAEEIIETVWGRGYRMRVAEENFINPGISLPEMDVSAA